MRRTPSPERVTRPPPSMTMRGPWSLRTLAVAVMVMIIGAGPQSNVMMPPAATALTTAADVQLAAVPVPTVRVGRLVSTGRAAAGTATLPCEVPDEGLDAGDVVGFG